MEMYSYLEFAADSGLHTGDHGQAVSEFLFMQTTLILVIIH
jgi:hypothetical protein